MYPRRQVSVRGEPSIAAILAGEHSPGVQPARLELPHVELEGSKPEHRVTLRIDT